MVVYLDTSSLVKLYVQEDGTSQVDAQVGFSEIISTSIVAYAEARAAFARRFREKAYTVAGHERIKACFYKDWKNYLVLNITDTMIRFAGDLAEKHSLKGFDSIHLASALTLHRELSAPVIFSCFDDRLQKASELEGLDQGFKVQEER